MQLLYSFFLSFCKVGQKNTVWRRIAGVVVLVLPVGLSGQTPNWLWAKTGVEKSFKIQHSTFDIDLSKQGSGIYFLHVISENSMITQKIIVE